MPYSFRKAQYNLTLAQPSLINMPPLIQPPGQLVFPDIDLLTDRTPIPVGDNIELSSAKRKLQWSAVIFRIETIGIGIVKAIVYIQRTDFRR